MADKCVSTHIHQRPPIIAVLGHVDHGKTTLLDYIRNTQIALKEHGGITQHIGAYQITCKSQIPNAHQDSSGQTTVKNEEDCRITFVDTPGHEAFMNMRQRGATVADIVLLVVAADDSVKPQTKESIRIIKETATPMIVVVNKIDMPGANIDRVKQDLARSEVQVEGFGGSVPIVLVSAKTGKGIDLLLEKIIELAKTLDLSSNMNHALEAVVIETHVDKGRGMVASVIVKDGCMRVGMPLYEHDMEIAKVRALFTYTAQQVKEAFPGMPIEVLGYTKLPAVGSVLHSSPVPVSAAQAQIIEKPYMSAEDFLAYSDQQQQQRLKIIIKADTAGSLEAIIGSLADGAVIVSHGVGEVTEADILLAKSVGAFVIAFHVKWKGSVSKLAETEGVVLRGYTVIYELLEEVNEALSGMQEVLTKERELGKGIIIAEFPYDGKRVAGVKVLSGRIAKGDQVKIFRNDEEIGRAKVKSIRKGKEEVTKMEIGTECGILFDGKVDFILSDAIIAFIRS